MITGSAEAELTSAEAELTSAEAELTPAEADARFRNYCLSRQQMYHFRCRFCLKRQGMRKTG